MNNEQTPPLGVAVDRDVGRDMRPHKVAHRLKFLADVLRFNRPVGQWPNELTAADLDVAVEGLTELDRLRAERDALREALAGAVNVLDLLRTYADAKYDYASSRAGTLVHVSPTIDAAKALLTPNAVVSGGRSPSA
jgi:hypothetical protein